MDSRRRRDVCRLRELIGRLGEVAGADVEAPAAVLVDWDSAWPRQQDAHPSEAIDPFRIATGRRRAPRR